MSYNLFFSMSPDPIPLKNCKSLHLLDLFLFHRCLVDGHYLVSWTPVFQGWHWLFLDMLVVYWVRVRGDAEHPTAHKAACATTKTLLSKPGSGLKHGNMANRFAIQSSCKWYRRSQIISGFPYWWCHRNLLLTSGALSVCKLMSLAFLWSDR